MKKSTTILLTGLFLSAIATTQCKKKQEEWMSVKSDRKDTVVNSHPYRYYGGYWYPLYNGYINPTHYNGFSNNQMRSGNTSSIRPTYRSSSSFSSGSHSTSSSIKSGGFGSSSRGFSIGG